MDILQWYENKLLKKYRRYFDKLIDFRVTQRIKTPNSTEQLHITLYIKGPINPEYFSDTDIIEFKINHLIRGKYYILRLIGGFEINHYDFQIDSHCDPENKYWYCDIPISFIELAAKGMELI